MSHIIQDETRYMDEVKSLNLNREQKYRIKTFGCQMNENDSEKIAGILEAMGYSQSTEDSGYDIVVYNTCCVRESAENKIYGHLGMEKKTKEANPDLIVALCGCMAQQEEAVAAIRKSYPHVDIVFGTHNIHRFPALLFQLLRNECSQFEVVPDSEGIVECLPVKRRSKAEAYVPVMYGCDNFCSYCIVPYVRGREKSRSYGEIRREVESLVHAGVREITLLGQNVNSYGKNTEECMDFAGLLSRLQDTEGLERIRFMTSHPKDISENLLIAIRDLPKVCKHLHLPLQSGSTRVLRDMNRNYTKEHYISILENIAREIPGIGLSTDVIVGFPGETEEDFQDTLDILERIRFDFAYTFIYSKRRHTPAADRTDMVPDEVKSERFDRLVRLQNAITLENNLKEIGKTMPVLVTGPSRNPPGMFTGRTGSNKIVHFSGNPAMTGKIINILIKDAKTWHLEGEAL
ncbi:MAG: tRNA (N6-isopentenyl adenosine(37)-C2)-methylthiotransferase MiaB [Clostridia bacterium]